jgi:hypothetical protein
MSPGVGLDLVFFFVRSSIHVGHVLASWPGALMEMHVGPIVKKEKGGVRVGRAW